MMQGQNQELDTLHPCLNKVQINRGGITNHGSQSSGQQALNIVDIISPLNRNVKE